MNNDLYYIFDACLALPCLALPCLALPCLANNLNFLFNLSKNQYYIKSFSYDFLILYLIIYLIKLLNIKIFKRLFKSYNHFSLIINQKFSIKGII